MLLFFAGFLLSLFGSLPPGLISLSVSQTSITRGLTAALALAAGAALAEFFQAWVAVLLTDWFLSHPMAERGFHWAAFPVFLFLGVYLFFFAKAPNPKAPRMPSNLGRQFMKGTIVSLFNLMAIPYWFVYCGSLKVEGYWQEGLIYTLIFAFGVSIGTFGAPDSMGAPFLSTDSRCFRYLRLDFWCSGYPIRVKREPGENPGQSPLL